MSPGWLLLFGITHALAVAGGVYLGAMAAGGRLLQPRTYKAVLPQPPPNHAAIEDNLLRAALMSPNFDRTEYVASHTDIPIASTHPVVVDPAKAAQRILKNVMPVKPGQPSTLQGTVKK